nr:endophilin A3 [Hymenolepis microstoma]
MDKLKTKLHFSKGGKSKSNAGVTNKENEISEIKKLYMHYQKALNTVLQPSRRFKSSSTSKNGKSNTAVYEENGLATFIKKHNEHITGNFHQTLQDMSNTYEQIAAFKSNRDSHLQKELFNPINDSVLKDLNYISKLKKEVSEAESEVNSARKGTDKNPADRSAMDKLSKANSNYAQAKENLQRAINTFENDEPNRINMFIQAAQIQQDFYKNAADSFSQLVANLNTIKERSINNTSSHENTSYNATKSHNEGLAYTTTVNDYNFSAADHKGNVEHCKCRALYDFTAEAEDDLSLHKGDEPTILEQVDDQWYYGELNGKKGHFPVEFVEKI